MYYETCPDCGANLDPGERCDCKKNPPRSGDNLDGLTTGDDKFNSPVVYHSPAEVVKDKNGEKVQHNVY